jgi:hypothetical protein
VLQSRADLREPTPPEVGPPTAVAPMEWPVIEIESAATSQSRRF